MGRQPLPMGAADSCGFHQIMQQAGTLRDRIDSLQTGVRSSAVTSYRPHRCSVCAGVPPVHAEHAQHAQRGAGPQEHAGHVQQRPAGHPQPPPYAPPQPLPPCRAWPGPPQHDGPGEEPHQQSLHFCYAFMLSSQEDIYSRAWKLLQCALLPFEVAVQAILLIMLPRVLLFRFSERGSVGQADSLSTSVLVWGVCCV